MTTRLCEAKASFSSTRSMSLDGDPGALEELPHRGHRADPHHPRVDSGNRATDERAERLDAERLGAFLARDHERRGAVVDPARVPGSDRSALAEDGLQRRHLLGARVGPRMLVASHALDRDDLLVEAAGLVGGGPALAAIAARTRPAPRGSPRSARRRSRRSRPSTRAGTSPPCADSGSASRASCPTPSGHRAEVVGLGHHERRAAHGLDSAGDEEVAVTGRDRVRGRDDRREPGGAEPVQGHARDRLGQPREQRRHARNVPVVFSRLVRGAEVDVLDLVRATHRRARPPP